MADTTPYTVTAGDKSLTTIGDAQGVALADLQRVNPALGKLKPPWRITVGDVIQIPNLRFKLKKAPFLVATAKDTNIKPVKTFADGARSMSFGQDMVFSTGAKPPQGWSGVGTKEADLQGKMRKLLDQFAKDDKSGKASRLVEAFLKKNKSVQLYTDPAFDRDVAVAANFQPFADRAMGLPTAKGIRIHQALKAAGWNINAVKPLTDLGVPAWNEPNSSWGKFWRQGDWGNGLALMVNGVQYVYVDALDYIYDAGKQTYSISLRFSMYDVFGLDDEDLRRYGAKDSGSGGDAEQGIAAWWQLQRQFGYAPLITRAVVELDKPYKNVSAR